jgi:hypothetical protein
VGAVFATPFTVVSDAVIGVAIVAGVAILGPPYVILSLTVSPHGFIWI